MSKQDWGGERAKADSTQRPGPQLVLSVVGPMLIVLFIVGLVWLHDVQNLFSNQQRVGEYRPTAEAGEVAPTAQPTIPVPTMPALPATTSRDSWVGVMHDASNRNASPDDLHPPLHEAWRDPKLFSFGVEQNELITEAAGRLLVSTLEDTRLYDAKTGKFLMTVPLAHLIAYDDRNLTSLSRDGNFVYYITNELQDGRSDKHRDIVAYNLHEGKIAWHYQTGYNTVFVQHPIANELIVSYEMASGTGPVVALNALTGEVIWRSRTLSSMATKPKIAADRANVYLYLDDGKLVALNGNNGIVRWMKLAAGHKLIIDGQHIYLTQGHGVQVFRADDGSDEPDFSFKDSITYDRYTETVISGGNLLVATTTNTEASRGRLISIRQKQVLWTTYMQELPRQIVASDKTLYLIAESYEDGCCISHKYLIAYEQQTGKELWRSADLIQPDYDERASRPIIADGMLYLIHGNAIHAYGGAQ